jgi:hypothetical protein
MRRLLTIAALLIMADITGCDQPSTGYWNQIGELRLHGADLEIVAPIEDNEDSTTFLRGMFIAPLDRHPDGRLDGLMISMHGFDTLRIDRETKPGAFLERVFHNRVGSKDGDTVRFRIPNRVLLREPVRIWSGGNKGRLLIGGIELKKKKGIRMDDPTDPYHFVLVHPE